ncbi:DUF3500 domain-containing protein [Actinomadura rudentiformis]|uniref:DUF3500 domain-containing protein n=2 Tax=Actinomadura rudentiformis TaxID=359158 RepID=A0A6H9YET6_9ACTN|nr:DUF3500 domain-containing protein [Actinomadura rudentiformis]
MRSAARGFLTCLTDGQHAQVLHPFTDPARTQWSYMPRPRPGVSLVDLSATARKAAHCLLATALSRNAFAQAVTIMAFEEVLDLDEAGRRGRHSDDYWTAVFGDPDKEMWCWRFEGHHLSVTATIHGEDVVAAPLFLGANPARIHDQADSLLFGPLWREEDLARALLSDLPSPLRHQAVVAQTAPSDLITGTAPQVEPFDQAGVCGADLPSSGRDLLHRLISVYLDRLHPTLARPELDLGEVTFAWAGGPRPGQSHYYRIQTPHLLIEYDNTQRDANHAHTVLRRPGADFGADLLPAHLATEQR